MVTIFYKLNEKETRDFLYFIGLTENFINEFISVAKSRKPDKFLKSSIVESYKIPLNKAKTIYISPVHFYGGEHFGEPYYFISEITHITTENAFSKWVNMIRKAGFNLPLRDFYY